MTIRDSLSDFMLSINIEKQTLFNHYVCSRMSLKTMKSETKLVTVLLPEMEYLSAEFIFKDSFDIERIIFRLHLHLLMDLSLIVWGLY